MRLDSEDMHPREKVIKARLGIGGGSRQDQGVQGRRKLCSPSLSTNTSSHAHPTPIPGSLLLLPVSSSPPALAAAPCPKALFTLSVSCPPRASVAQVRSAHIKLARRAFGARYRKVAMSTWRTRPRLHVITKLQYLLKKRNIYC